MFKTKVVNYPKCYKSIKKEVLSEINRILSRGDLILRDDVEKFEDNLARFVGKKYAIGLSSGTDALILALKAIGIKPGDEVIVPAHTFVATIAAVVHCGAKPVVVDIGDDLLIDPDGIKKAITPKTRAIIPVHLAGAVCDMAKIMRMSEYYGFIVIEDACQSLGAKGVGRGLISCYSFYPAKILGAYGDAGAIATNSKKIAEKIRSLRHGGRGENGNVIQFGFTARLDNIQAAILNVKFKYLPEYIKRRQEIAEMYYDFKYDGLKDIKEIKLPNFQEGRVWQDFIIRIEDRDKLMEYLKSKGIETMSGNCSMPFPLTDFKNTIKANQQALRLPICPELTDEEVNDVIKYIKKFYESR